MTEFLWRRIHSFTGFWLVLYLLLHLITNSQAGLWIGDDGHGFIRMVNRLENLPYLQLVEVMLIGVPILLHGAWGVRRAFHARHNQKKSDGSTPSLPFERNRAFAWQRLSSWILLIGIIGHVAQMRFIDAPKKVMMGTGESHFVKVTFDEGLYTLATRLGVTILTPQEIHHVQDIWRRKQATDATTFAPTQTTPEIRQETMTEQQWMQTLTSYHLHKNEVIAVAATPGTAYLLMVRNTFKDPVMAALYTLFLLAAVFHAGNGLWTFLITWGLLLSYKSQRALIPVSLFGMLFLTTLGLAAIWCSYWVNLRY